MAATPDAIPVRPEGAAHEVMVPTAAMVQFAQQALRAGKLELVGEATLVRHRAGDRGLPAFSDNAQYRFAVDLTDARSSVDGGVLLFIDGDGRGSGWRAEAGATTVWSGPDPELTELVPGAPERLTLIGLARALRSSDDNP